MFSIVYLSPCIFKMVHNRDHEWLGINRFHYFIAEDDETHVDDGVTANECMGIYDTNFVMSVTSDD